MVVAVDGPITKAVVEHIVGVLLLALVRRWKPVNSTIIDCN